MTHGGRLEEFEILGEMPRDRASIPDHPVLRHCDDGFYHLEKRKAADSRAAVTDAKQRPGKQTQRRRDEEKEILQLFCLKTPRLCASAGK
jgi:hypothetical protein